MKRRLNLLCAIVLLVMGWSVAETGYYLVIGAHMGIQAGWNYAKAEAEGGKAGQTSMKELEKLRNLTYISTLPGLLQGDGNKLLQDSVYNARTRRYVPAAYSSLLVSVETRQSKASAVTSGVLGLLVFVTTVWALVLFIKLIVRINRSDIFNWRNVRRLRRLGLLLLLAFGCTLLQEWLKLQAVRQVLEMPGYELTLSDTVKGSTLLLGLCALIVAEVFAIGLKMKEEQELTI